jgi:hypothetical protein
MNSNAYRLLGLAVWKGTKWYVRRRLPSRRTLALAGITAGAGIAAARAIGGRIIG